MASAATSSSTKQSYDDVILNGEKKNNIQLKDHLTLLEICINKVEEIMLFERELEKIDKKIRDSLIHNETLFYKDIFLLIQEFLLN